MLRLKNGQAMLDHCWCSAMTPRMGVSTGQPGLDTTTHGSEVANKGKSKSSGALVWAAWSKN